MGRLDGKVALVVGASPNNGGTTAHFMAREGAQIAASDLIPEACEETAEFIRSQGYDAIGLAGDASDVDSVQEVVNQTVEHFGKIDILVNMAGKQYRWPVWDTWNASLFWEEGQVFDDFGDIEADGFGSSVGVGLTLRTETAFLLGLRLAHSARAKALLGFALEQEF